MRDISPGQSYDHRDIIATIGQNTEKQIKRLLAHYSENVGRCDLVVFFSVRLYIINKSLGDFGRILVER